MKTTIKLSNFESIYHCSHAHKLGDTKVTEAGVQELSKVPHRAYRAWLWTANR
jgi:hypothetical protein